MRVSPSCWTVLDRAGRIGALQLEEQPTRAPVESSDFDERRFAYEIENGGHEEAYHSSIRLTRLGEHLSPFKRRLRANHLSNPASPIASGTIHHLVSARCPSGMQIFVEHRQCPSSVSNRPVLSIYADTPSRGYSWAKWSSQVTRSDLSHSGRHNDNDERQRLFKRSAPSYVEGGPIAEIL